MVQVSQGRGLLFILGAAHSLNHSLFLVLPPLLESVSRDLNASFQTLGTIATVSFFIYGLGALFGGPLSDVLGGVRVTRLSLALSGASTFVFLLSRDTATFAAGMFLMALWSSFYHPTSNNLISRTYVTNTAGAMGIHGAAGSLGQIFTPTIAYVLGATIDWRFAFVLFGVLSLITALVMGKASAESDSETREKMPLLEIFRVSNIWLIILFNALIGLYSRGIELFFPTFLSVSRGFSGQLAAISNSLILLFGVAGQLLGGAAADRYGSSGVLTAYTLGVVASALLLMLLPINAVGVVIFIVGYGISFFGHQPAMTALMGEVSPRSLMGAAYGAMFFFVFGLGSFSTMMAGYLADAFDLEAAFWFMSLFAVMALLVAVAIQLKVRSGNRSVPTSAASGAP